MCNPSKRKLIANVNKSCPERSGGDRKSVAGRRLPPRRGRQGSSGGCETRCRNEEDGFVGEGRRKGDLKRRTLIGGDEAPGVLAVTFTARYLFAFK